MKKYFLIFLFIVLLIPKIYAYSRTEITVLKVYDGDSILAEIDKTNSIFRIRLLGIDCFEGTKSSHAVRQAEKYNIEVDEVIKRGNLAGDILREELKDKKVYFEFMGMDKYKRALGNLYVKNENINNKMLKTGYCEVYKKN